MPNTDDVHYQADEIRRKLSLVSQNTHLTPVERKFVADVIYEHLAAILTADTHTASCVVCKAPLTNGGKCPNRNEEGHTIKRDQG
jgi:hypothetical protein